MLLSLCANKIRAIFIPPFVVGLALFPSTLSSSSSCSSSSSLNVGTSINCNGGERQSEWERERKVGKKLLDQMFGKTKVEKSVNESVGFDFQGAKIRFQVKYSFFVCTIPNWFFPYIAIGDAWTTLHIQYIFFLHFPPLLFVLGVNGKVFCVSTNNKNTRTREIEMHTHSYRWNPKHYIQVRPHTRAWIKYMCVRTIFE